MEIELLSSDNIKIYIYEKIDCNADIRNVVKEYIDKLKSKLKLNGYYKVYTYYRKIGYTVLKNTEIDTIRKMFEHKITVFTGQSGAGKSTLMNHVDPSLKIETNEISLALGRGKHTTRHVELLPIQNGLVADTPGFSSLDFYDMKPADIRDNFIEFNEYREFCKYRDCMHNKEDECEVKKKVEDGTILKSRYENYLHFIEKR